MSSSNTGKVGKIPILESIIWESNLAPNKCHVKKQTGQINVVVVTFSLLISETSVLEMPKENLMSARGSKKGVANGSWQCLAAAARRSSGRNIGAGRVAAPPSQRQSMSLLCLFVFSNFSLPKSCNFTTMTVVHAS